MADEPRKRSRFDQEPEAPRKSRFDRRSRSRSPARRGSDHHRERSPRKADGKQENGASSTARKADAAAAAAAAAAKINASLQARRGIQHVDVPPIQRPNSSTQGADSPSSSTPPGSGLTKDEVYTQDGDFIKDIEVNNHRNRYTLTKGSTQRMIKEKTGADVTTRGNYYPDKSMATAANPPLYLHVTSTTKEGLEKAVAEIETMLKQELPNLIDERRFRRREPEQQVERDHLGRRKWPEERIPIDLEPIPGFNLRAQVVGQGGSYVKHIQQETRCRVQIKGRGSGFVEHDTGHESDEQMFLHVQGPDANDVQGAKDMCLELLETVKASYDQFKENRNQRHYGGGDRGGRGGYNHGQHGGDQYGYSGQQGYNGGGGHHGYGGGHASPPPPPPPPPDTAAPTYGGYGGQAGYSDMAAYSDPSNAQHAAAMAPVTTQNTADSQAQMQAWISYYAANPEQDPYAQYGGYGAMIAQYYGQAAAQTQEGAVPEASTFQPQPPPPPPAASSESIQPPAPGTQGVPRAPGT